MKRVTEQQAYEDLANAVVAQACNDYLEGRKHLWSLEYGPMRHKDYSKRSRLIVKWSAIKDSAESFLRGENLHTYTSVSGEYLLSKLDKEFETWKSNK